MIMDNGSSDGKMTINQTRVSRLLTTQSKGGGWSDLPGLKNEELIQQNTWGSN